VTDPSYYSNLSLIIIGKYNVASGERCRKWRLNPQAEMEEKASDKKI